MSLENQRLILTRNSNYYFQFYNINKDFIFVYLSTPYKTIFNIFRTQSQNLIFPYFLNIRICLDWIQKLFYSEKLKKLIIFQSNPYQIYIFCFKSKNVLSPYKNDKIFENVQDLKSVNDYIQNSFVILVHKSVIKLNLAEEGLKIQKQEGEKKYKKLNIKDFDLVQKKIAVSENLIFNKKNYSNLSLFKAKYRDASEFYIHSYLGNGTYFVSIYDDENDFLHSFYIQLY